MSDASDTPGDPACHAHLLVGGHAVDPQTRRDVARFRKAERTRLYAWRRGLPSDERQRKTAAIIDNLARLEIDFARRKVALYWPIRGEPDLRPWMTGLNDAGSTVLLPVVTARESPLEFRPWQPGCRMERGIWNIPVPADGPPHDPEIVISPLVGFDRAGFRLGNGGGYYDRTLAALRPQPIVIGAGFDACFVETIFPMPWDIPMDRIVTESGVRLPSR